MGRAAFPTLLVVQASQPEKGWYSSLKRFEMALSPHIEGEAAD